MRKGLSFFSFLNRLLILISLFCGTYQGLQAQEVPTVGTEFWFTFLENNASDVTDSLKIFITAQEATTGQVSIPGPSGVALFEQSFSVQAGITHQVIVPNNIGEHTTNPESPQNRAILVTSEDTVSVFAINFQQQTADGTKILPTASLGTRYRIASYPGLQNAPSQFAIVATADGTQVTITPAAITSTGRPAGVPFTVNLNRGQTYWVTARNFSTDDLTGTLIEATAVSGSCRPFAVFSGANCANVPSSCQRCDHLFEQNFPTNTWGQRYLLAPFSNTAHYTYRVIANENSTTFTVNGGAAQTLNAGQVFEQNFMQFPAYISASKPVQVVQFMESHFTCGTGQGDPAMAVLNSEDQRISKVTFSTVQSNVIVNHNLNIIAETGDVGQVLIDGVPINPTSFQVFANRPTFSFVRLSIAEGSHTIEAPNGVTGYVYGSGTRESYLYSVGSFNKARIQADGNICADDSVTLQSPIFLSNAWWARVNAPNDTLGTGQTLRFLPTTTEYIKIEGGSNLSGCQEERRILVEVPTPPNITVTNNPDTVCRFQPVQMEAQATPASDLYTYTWRPAADYDDPNVNNPTYYPTRAGYATVTVSTPTGCGVNTDSAFVYVSPGIISDFEVSGNNGTDTTLLCRGDSADFNLTVEQILVEDDFDTILPTGFKAMWTQIQGANQSTGCGHLGNFSLQFGNPGARTAQTIPLDLTNGGTIRYDLKIASAADGCDAPEFGEDVVLEYSTNGGISFTQIKTHFTTLYNGSFKTEKIEIPTAAQTNQTILRWRQIGVFSSNNADVWLLDNIFIATNRQSSYAFTWQPAGIFNNPAAPQAKASPDSSMYVQVSITEPGTGCAYADSVFVSIGQPFTTITTPDTLICQTGNVPIATTPQTPGNYTVLWQPQDLVANPDQLATQATATTTATYTTTITNDFGCVTHDTLTITRGANYALSLTQQPFAVCQDDSVTLQANVGLSCGAFDLQCNGSTNNAPVISGAFSSGNGSISPFRPGTPQRRQWLLTQNELATAGIAPGSLINSLTLQIDGIQGASQTTVNDLAIKLGCTPVGSLAGGFQTDLHQVYDPTNTTVAQGPVTLTFDRPYYYAGQSLVIDLCNQGTSIGGNVRILFSFGNFNSVAYIEAQPDICNQDAQFVTRFQPATTLGWCNPTSLNNISYSWNNSAFLANSNQATTKGAFPSGSFNMVVLVTDTSTGCAFSDSLLLTVDSPFSINLPADTFSCTGDPITIKHEFPGSQPSNYGTNWFYKGSLISIQRDSVEVNTLTSGELIAQVNSTQGCQATDTMQIIVSKIRSVNILADSTNLCFGNSLELEAQPTPPVLFYESFDGFINFSNWTEFTGVSSSVNNCGTAEGSLGAARFEGNVFRFITTAPIDVSNGATLSFYLKSGNLPGICDPPDPGDDLIVQYQPLGSTTWITLQQFNNANYPTFTKIEIALPLGAQTAGTRIRFRQIGSLTFNQDVIYIDEVQVKGSLPNNLSLQWQPTAGLSHPDSLITNATPANSPQQYKISITDTATSCTYTDSITITTNQAEAPAFVADSLLCNARGGQLVLSGLQPGDAVLWQPGSAVADSTAQTTTLLFDNNVTIRYYVTKANGCVLKPGVVNIKSIGRPTATTGPDTSICLGNSYTLNASGGTAYSWLPTNGLSNPSISNPIASPSATTTYSVVVTDNNGCTDTAYQQLTINPLPTITPLSDTAICQTDSLLLEPGNTAHTYLWNTGKTTSTIWVNTTGTYKVVATTTQGCQDSTQATLTVNPLPVVDLGNDTAICASQTLLLDAGNPGSSFVWNNGATTQTITPNASGGYRVTVTNNFGCSVADSINVTINPLPNVSLGSDTTVCADSLITLQAGSISDQIIWTLPGATTVADTTQILANAPGRYNVTVTDTNGCTVKDSIFMVINPLPTVDLGNDTAICNYQTITLNASNPSSVYNWRGPGMPLIETQPIVTVNQTGQYSVLVINTAGCRTADTINVTVNNQPNLRSSADTILCLSDTITLRVSGAATYQWTPTTALTNPNDSVTLCLPANTTTFYVTGTDTNGCQSTDSVQIDVIDTPDSLLPASLQSCYQVPQRLDVQIPFLESFAWSDADTNLNRWIRQPGQYVLTATTRCKITTDTVNFSWYHTYNLPQIELNSRFENEACPANPINIRLLDFPEGAAYAQTLWYLPEGRDPLFNLYSFDAENPGLYRIRVIDPYGCVNDTTFQIKPGETRLELTNIITANNDNLNDAFTLGNSYCVKEAQVRIVNRWGIKVYESNDVNFRWDGKNASSGIFFYTIRTKDFHNRESKQQGWIQLVK